MTVKTGHAWAGTFVTLDATGALAAGTPSGVLYVDGTANGATVTITGSNPYKWAVTLPTLTAGQSRLKGYNMTPQQLTQAYTPKTYSVDTGRYTALGEEFLDPYSSRNRGMYNDLLS